MTEIVFEPDPNVWVPADFVAVEESRIQAARETAHILVTADGVNAPDLEQALAEGLASIMSVEPRPGLLTRLVFLPNVYASAAVVDVFVLAAEGEEHDRHSQLILDAPSEWGCQRFDVVELGDSQVLRVATGMERTGRLVTVPDVVTGEEEVLSPVMRTATRIVIPGEQSIDLVTLVELTDELSAGELFAAIAELMRNVALSAQASDGESSPFSN